MRKLLIIILVFTYGCASTGVKQETQLNSSSKDMANVYIYRLGGFLYMGVRAIVKINGQKVGSLYAKDFVKIDVPEGQHTLTIAGDPWSGVFGKTKIPVTFEKGKNYYFITGVNSSNVLGSVVGGAIGSAVVGGPFPTQQVNQETFDRQKYK
jgi:hypothetical protein